MFLPAPPHVRLSSPVQGMSHSESFTEPWPCLSYELPQKHSVEYCTPANLNPDQYNSRNNMLMPEYHDYSKSLDGWWHG